MKNKLWMILSLSLVLMTAGVYLTWELLIRRQAAHKDTTHRDKVDAFSGATPLALERPVPGGLSLTVDGKVKQEYHLNSPSFRLLAKTRIRTPEVLPGGEVTGNYIYTGIPVLYILEGVRPEKGPEDAFDRPMDMVVVFTSGSGRQARFSYGELTCGDDALPVTLAFHREPLRPNKAPGKYTKNKTTENLDGLRLICPREPDTSRYLDNVVRMTLAVPSTPDSLLPPVQKKKDCTSPSITCVDGEKQWTADLENIPVKTIDNWVRTGHGRGLKGDRTVTASGYLLPAFLKHNFPDCGADDFFVLTACDGYRGIFSGRELFATAAGNGMLLLTGFNGKPPKNSFTVGTVSDFFIDRSIRNVTHIVRLD